MPPIYFSSVLNIKSQSDRSFFNVSSIASCYPHYISHEWLWWHRRFDLQKCNNTCDPFIVCDRCLDWKLTWEILTIPRDWLIICRYWWVNGRMLIIRMDHFLHAFLELCCFFSLLNWVDFDLKWWALFLKISRKKSGTGTRIWKIRRSQTNKKWTCWMEWWHNVMTYFKTCETVHRRDQSAESHV